MKVSDVTHYLETIAPRDYQESYDNCGLLTGTQSQEVTGILITLDCTEAVVEEAIEKKCNLIIAHHPILFRGIKKLTGSTYVERTIIQAIRNNVAIYAIHTNLDNVHVGVNKKLAEKIGLTNLKILAPKSDTLSKLVTFVPERDMGNVLNALHHTGAGQLGNYKNCSFRVEGIGSFMPNEVANPHLGAKNQQEEINEFRIEVLFPSRIQKNLVGALKKAHPYEEVAYYCTPISNENQEVGSGMVGDLKEALEPLAFLKLVKSRLGLSVIRHTEVQSKNIKKVAICGGAGAFLISHALQSDCQAFITSDIKYHEFFDADNRLLLADIGHYESEVHTKELLGDILNEKFPTFALNFSETITNPVQYLI